MIVRMTFCSCDYEVMGVDHIMKKLHELGSEQTKKTLVRHGAVEPLFGVKISDLKPLVKEFRNSHALALDLYATGNSDAMYLAGLIANKDEMTQADLQDWATKATWSLIANTTVACLAAETSHALELIDQWITAEAELVAACGWSTAAHYASITANDQIDLVRFNHLLNIISTTIHDQSDLLKGVMNHCLISLGCFVPELTPSVKRAAQLIGEVSIDHGETACKTPSALEAIKKVEELGKLGKKKKRARC